MAAPENHLKHHRRSIRLADHDYSAEGRYFITMVTKGRECLFGDVINGEMKLNEFEMIVSEEWFRSASICKEIELDMDEFVVMPNHIHGVIWINDVSGGITTNSKMIDHPTVGAYSHTPLRSPSHTIGAIIRGFKGAVTTRINTIRDSKGTPVWQRNYFEHIIISEKDYEKIVNYIYLNPFSWETDSENQ